MSCHTASTGRFADDANTVAKGGDALFDAVVRYDFAAVDARFRGVSAQVNGCNVLDRAATTCQAGYCYRVQPATGIASLISVVRAGPKEGRPPASPSAQVCFDFSAAGLISCAAYGTF